MGAVKIPVDRLTPETLQSVVEEFITREGTDYGPGPIPIWIEKAEVTVEQ